jgi:ABC-2 type transport system ATP-binding protein
MWMFLIVLAASAWPVDGAPPVIRKDGQLAITYKMGEQSIEHLLKRLREANVGIGDLATEEPDLEDVFVSLTSG